MCVECVLCMYWWFFFFKQKTAYEMRISDWSSDVCSSDLYRPKRGIVIAYSGDEETTMITSKIIAERLKGARLVLNVDGASGTLDEKSGKIGRASCRERVCQYV